jgi:hypothetical protein
MAAVVSLAQLLERSAGGSRRAGRRDVRGERGLAQDAGVEYDGPVAPGEDHIADEFVLVAFRVQRADEQDRLRHDGLLRPPPRRAATSIALYMSTS